MKLATTLLWASQLIWDLEFKLHPPPNTEPAFLFKLAIALTIAQALAGNGSLPFVYCGISRILHYIRTLQLTMQWSTQSHGQCPASCFQRWTSTWSNRTWKPQVLEDGIWDLAAWQQFGAQVRDNSEKNAREWTTELGVAESNYLIFFALLTRMVGMTAVCFVSGFQTGTAEEEYWRWDKAWSFEAALSNHFKPRVADAQSV